MTVAVVPAVNACFDTSGQTSVSVAKPDETHYQELIRVETDAISALRQQIVRDVTYLYVPSLPQQDVSEKVAERSGGREEFQKQKDVCRKEVDTIVSYIEVVEQKRKDIQKGVQESQSQGRNLVSWMVRIPSMVLHSVLNSRLYKNPLDFTPWKISIGRLRMCLLTLTLCIYCVYTSIRSRICIAQVICAIQSARTVSTNVFHICSQIEHERMTSSISINEEKKIFADIEKLRKCKPELRKVNDLQSRVASVDASKSLGNFVFVIDFV